MELETYLTYAEYVEMGGTIITETEAATLFPKISRQIDVLTFGRITKQGYDNLTEYQKAILKQVCASMAEFDHGNADALNMALGSYDINGVKISYKNTGFIITVVNGIPARTIDLSKLDLTGLTARNFDYDRGGW